MKNFFDILLLFVAVVLPIGLGYFFRNIKLFDEKECNALRKFVIKVSVPFLIFKNLYRANIDSLGQFFPSATAFILMTVMFTVSGFYLSRRITPVREKQNAFSFSVFMGNYGFLGWGVVYSFFGDAALTRAVFFTMVFWPVFLLCGFWLVHRDEQHPTSAPPFLKVLLKNGAVPILTAITGIAMNLLKVPVPETAWNFVEKFAAFTIPMILFTIGLNFQLLMPRAKFRVLLSASIYRLVFGFGVGLLALIAVRLIFSVDAITQKVILVESIMPTATMTVFFTEYARVDKELHSGIIAFSTLLSLATIPFWYVVVERFF